MKKNTLSLFASLLLLCSCYKLEDSNVNPNEPVFVTASALLNWSIYSLATNSSHNSGLAMQNLFCQHFSEAYTSISRYQLSPYYFDFRSFHSILDLQQIIRLCAEEPDAQRGGGDPANQIAQARILKAWLFQTMTDRWGDIPYTEAVSDKLAPRYDTQESIYRDLLRELDEAAAQIRPDAPGPVGTTVNADALYIGNMAQWKKFANSTALRVAIRMADRDWPTAKTAIEKAYTGGVFDNNNDNARYIFFPPPSIYPNPFSVDYSYYIPGNMYPPSYCISKPLMDVLKGLDDPRIPKYAAPAFKTGQYEGRPYGLELADNLALDGQNYSPLSEKAAAPDGQVVMLDYAEVCFILAEAIERGAAIPGSAADWYHKGIRASLEWWGVDATATIDTYLARPDVRYDTAPGTWKEKIGKQKWLALFLQGGEAWTEWRRLDFGILQPPPGLDFIPTRYLYPDNEQIVNKKSYDEAVSRLPGGDKLTSKVWWDVY